MRSEVDVPLGGLLETRGEGVLGFLVRLLPRLELLEHAHHRGPGHVALHEQIHAEQIGLALLPSAPGGQHELVGGVGGELHVGHVPGVALGDGALAGERGLGANAQLVERLALALHVAEQVRAVMGEQHVGELVGEDGRDLVRALERVEEAHGDVDVAVGRGERLEARVGQDHHPPRHAGPARDGQQAAPGLVQVLLERGRAHEAERVAAMLGEILLLAHREARRLVGSGLEPGQDGGGAGSLAREPGGGPRGRRRAVASRPARAAAREQPGQHPGHDPGHNPMETQPGTPQLQLSPTPRTAPVLGGRPATRVLHSSSLTTGTTRSVSTAKAFTQ